MFVFQVASQAIFIARNRQLIDELLAWLYQDENAALASGK